ncbi:MAG: hypothetical protein AAF571_03530 [Verrucomicrobiota bacterium]
MLALPFVLCAQDDSRIVTVDLELESASLFQGVAAQAKVVFAGQVDSVEQSVLPRDTPDISFLRQEVTDLAPDQKGQVQLMLTFLPRKSGLLLLPAMSWDSGGLIVRTKPVRLRVGSVKSTEAMKLVLIPDRHEAYVGEPVRIDVLWDCHLPAANLRQLMFHPTFVNQPGVEVEVPRVHFPETEQMGLPVAGRRIIARRELQEESTELGRITFSLFIRFTEPGDYSFEASRLELFRLLKKGGRFAPYASYFNNTLFEVVDLSSSAEYLFTESDPFQIKIHELPETGQEKTFSGLFAPVGIETSIKPDTGDVGQLMELTVRVTSDTAVGFLSLPDFSLQPGLQHRFWVEEEPRRVWRPDGAEFKVRFRPLTTSIQAFPSLAFQVFDSLAGRYQLRQTQAIPLEVRENDGQTVFRLEQSHSEDTILTDQSEGIWHNDTSRTVNDLMNTIINSMADGFWLWIVLVSGGAIACLPMIRERRRRATDATYRSQVRAYEQYRNSRAGGLEYKRDAFRAYLATMSQKSQDAFTLGDAEAWLQSFSVTDEDRATVRQLFQQEDAEKFDRRPKVERNSTKLDELDALAKRIFHLVQQEMK